MIKDYNENSANNSGIDRDIYDEYCDLYETFQRGFGCFWKED